MKIENHPTLRELWEMCLEKHGGDVEAAKREWLEGTFYFLIAFTPITIITGVIIWKCVFSSF